MRRRICLLDYPPNTRLREEDLASEFGVSRTPLRRVLGHLESEGLVKSVRCRHDCHGCGD
ncbi:MAG: GntR family transcriptional regulator [Thiolinea sp.]